MFLGISQIAAICKPARRNISDFRRNARRRMPISRTDLLSSRFDWSNRRAGASLLVIGRQSRGLHHAIEATWTLAGLRPRRRDNRAGLRLCIEDERLERQPAATTKRSGADEFELAISE